MSTFSGDIGPEEEDGGGWGGLVPTKAERLADAAEERRRQELAQLKADNAALRARQAVLVEALTELVRLKDLKQKIKTFQGVSEQLTTAERIRLQDLTGDYAANQPAAWSAARAALEQGEG